VPGYTWVAMATQDSRDLVTSARHGVQRPGEMDAVAEVGWMGDGGQTYSSEDDPAYQS
jgi:hypothetical protein